MSIINKLTFAHLKRNKGRTLVTILGIGVSVAMITAVFVSLASFFDFFGEAQLYSDGHWVAKAYSVSEETADKLASSDGVLRVGKEAELSAEETGFKIDGASARTSTGSVLAADTTALEQLVTCTLDGALPQNKNEILVEAEFIEDNDLDWQIGDTVTIPTGVRYYIYNGETEYIVGNYISGEVFEVYSTNEYTIVGILHDNAPTKSYQILRFAEESELTQSTVYVELEDVGMNSYSEITQILSDCGLTVGSYVINSDYLSANYSFETQNNTLMTMFPVIIIILIVIVAAGVALIYNAFGMSLSERVRYLGMLASVGATNAQKKASVYFEGFLLGLIGIPLGIGAGILGMYITFQAINPKVYLFISGASENLELRLIIPVWAVIGIIIVSALTIFISARVPAKRAAAVTPVAAIKQTNEIKVSAKKLKSSKIIRAIFGYEGELANKNLKRNGGKSRVITASIALSVILFLSVNSFCNLLIEANNLDETMSYQLYVYVMADDYEEMKEEVSLISGVDDLFSLTSVLTDQTSLFDDPYLNFVDDEDFNALCESNGIDYTEYYSRSSADGNSFQVLLLNNVSHESSENQAFSDDILGQSVTYNGNVELTITAFVDYDADNYVCNLNPSSSTSLYLPESMYEQIMASDESEDEFARVFGVVTDDHEQVASEIEKIIDEMMLTNAGVNDIVESSQTTMALLYVIEVFIYGFVALITLIAVANIINTVSTGIDLRRKEFAMFKSIGITPGGFKKMICLESLFYGIKALVIGIPLSILLTYFMYSALSSSDLSFTINIYLYLIVIAAVFIIVGASMFYAFSKLRKDSIVETLKEDIC